MNTARVIAAALATVAVGCGHARSGDPFRELDLDAQEQVGEVLYMRNCNGCHPGGAGGLGPGLADKPLPGLALKLQIRKGFGAMPGFSEKMLTDEEVDAIVAYVNKLQE